MQCRAYSGHFFGKNTKQPIGGHAASTDDLAAVLGPMFILEDTGLVELKTKTKSGFLYQLGCLVKDVKNQDPGGDPPVLADHQGI